MGNATVCRHWLGGRELGLALRSFSATGGRREERNNWFSGTTQARQRALLEQNRPRERSPVISGFDACLVLLKKAEISRPVIPARCWSFGLLPARSLGVEGQAQKTLQEAQAGLASSTETRSAGLSHSRSRPQSRNSGKSAATDAANFAALLAPATW